MSKAIKEYSTYKSKYLKIINPKFLCLKAWNAPNTRPKALINAFTAQGGFSRKVLAYNPQIVFHSMTPS